MIEITRVAIHCCLLSVIDKAKEALKHLAQHPIPAPTCVHLAAALRLMVAYAETAHDAAMDHECPPP